MLSSKDPTGGERKKTRSERVTHVGSAVPRHINALRLITFKLRNKEKKPSWRLKLDIGLHQHFLVSIIIYFISYEVYKLQLTIEITTFVIRKSSLS
ncbi:uncharacterized protein LOC107884531 isoform X2 [Acyrthosiphon pisum]|uniref:Uncharacterized protein n=1 Tax=Acyrthosiphon pisum TaxID=7029 RepID=A0A8R2NSR8_ACYPI|nr:uncharacterized protein LOC107884531 isoform X2 [Acyrthosiphon pisum]